MNFSKYSNYSDLELQELVGDPPLMLMCDRYREGINSGNVNKLIQDVSNAYATEIQNYLLYNTVEIYPNNNEHNFYCCVQQILNSYLQISAMTNKNIDNSRKIFYLESAQANDILTIPVLALADYIIKRCLDKNVTDLSVYVDKVNAFENTTKSNLLTNIVSQILAGVKNQIAPTVNQQASESMSFAIKDNLILMIVVVIIFCVVVFLIWTLLNGITSK